MTMPMMVVLAIAIVASAPAEPPRVIRADGAEAIVAALRAARPGDEVVVAPGGHRGFEAAEIHGSAERPIVLRAEDPARPPVFEGGIHLSRVAHLELRDLVVEGAAGNGINIDDGGRLDAPSHHLRLHRITVRRIGGRGNHDGIKLSGVEDFRLESCVLERWGRGGSAVDMVGCRRGLLLACAFRDDPRDPPSNAVQIKGGSEEIVVRACRFVHAGLRAVNLGGSTGLAYFRPKPQGFECRNAVVEGCTFIGSQAPVAFVGADGAVVRRNTIHLPGKWVLRILQETREPGFVPCRNGVFEDNLVTYRRREVATAVNIGPGTAPESFRFRRNWWYAVDDPPRSAPSLPVPEESGAGGLDPRFRDEAAGDLRLHPESPARAHGADSFVRGSE